MENKEYILFGAGEYGKKVIKKIGYENIRYIIDNDEKKQGTSIEGIEIISFDEYLKMEEKYPVLIGSDEIHRYEMEQQLKKMGFVIIDLSGFHSATMMYSLKTHMTQFLTKQRMNGMMQWHTVECRKE